MKWWPKPRSFFLGRALNGRWLGDEKIKTEHVGSVSCAKQAFKKYNALYTIFRRYMRQSQQKIIIQ